MRLLLAEDDEQLRRTVARGLREHAYAVDEVSNGRQALTEAVVNSYDLIVMDVVMPDLDGVSVCMNLRERGFHTPIILLTARDAISDRVTGLDAGADDYLVKPFVFDELLARLRALTRRRAEIIPGIISIEDLEVDTRRQEVRRAGIQIRLTAREYSFIEYLALHAGTIVSRAELAAHVWDDNHEPAANLIDVYVSRIRRKLGGDPPILRIRRGAGVVLGGGRGRTGDDR